MMSNIPKENAVQTTQGRKDSPDTNEVEIDSWNFMKKKELPSRLPMSNIPKENAVQTTQERKDLPDTNEVEIDSWNFMKKKELPSRLPKQGILVNSAIKGKKDYESKTDNQERDVPSWLAKSPGLPESRKENDFTYSAAENPDKIEKKDEHLKSQPITANDKLHYMVTPTNNNKKPVIRKGNNPGGINKEVQRQNLNLLSRIVNAKPVVSTNSSRELQLTRFNRPNRLDLMKNVKELEKGTLMPGKKQVIFKFEKLKRRGFLVIINFMFSGDKERKGSDEDVGNLCKFFTKLKYDIHCRSDLTTNELESYLEHVRHNYLSRDSSEYHCFICVIMSHGNENCISTKDGLINIDDIVHYFRNDALKRFVGKPKIFIFQACRGKEIQQKQGNDESHRVIQHDSSAHFNRLPTDADIFKIYATSPGHISYRTTGSQLWNGSWLINAFLRRASDMYLDYHILDIMTAVTFDLSTKPEYERDGEKCQIASTKSTLTKHFYL